MEKPLISVVIPTYNRAHLIGETLESIMRQTYPIWECIVVDDNSSDNTLEILNSYSSRDNRIKFFKRPTEKLKGANSCRNFGRYKAQGKWIIWFDDDDIMVNDLFHLILKQHYSEEVDFVVWGHLIFDESINNIRFTARLDTSKKNFFIDYLTGRINISTQTVMFSSKFISGMEFDELLHRSQDLDFFFRVFKDRSFKFEIVQAPLVYLRYHENSLTKAYYKNSIDSVKSELYVRRIILSYGQKERISLQQIKMLSGFYEEALSRLVMNFSLLEVYREMIFFGKKVSIKYSFVSFLMKLTFFFLIYRLTGRNYRLVQVVKNINNYLA